MKQWLAAVMATSVVACTTHLDTRPNGTSDKAAVGVPYALPMVHHELTVSRTLVGCKHSGGAITKLEFDTTVQHTPRYVAGERFIMDYRRLGNWHKTSGFKLTTYPNQTLKAVNAEADDRSPEIMGSTIKAALTIAQLSSGVGIGLSPASSLTKMLSEVSASPAIGDASRETADELLKQLARETSPCPEVLTWMQQTRDAIKKDSKELEKLSRQLDALIVPSLIGVATDADRKAISELRTRINARLEHQAELQRKYDSLAEDATFVETATFTPTRGAVAHVFHFPSKEGALEEVQLKQLARLFGQKPVPIHLVSQYATLSGVLDVPSGPDAGKTCTEAWLDDACDVTTDPAWKKESSAGTARSLPGVAFRNPVHGRLRVCKSASADDCRLGRVQPLLLDAAVTVPQLGQLIVLPFQNGFGANNKVEATFREDGSLDSLAYDAKEASGESAANLLGSGAEQVLAYEKQKHEQKEAERAQAEAAPLKALEAQLALLKKQQEIAEVEAARHPDSIAQDQELTRLQAQVARLTALKQIKELEEAVAGTGT